MFNCTDLITELVEILKVDNKVDREKALTCFAHFAKHAENRQALVKIGGLMDMFSKIIAPSPKPKLVNLPTKKPSTSSTKEVDSGNFELDSLGRIVIGDETALYGIDTKYFQKRKSSPRFTIDHIQFVPDVEEEEDFSVQEESPPRKKNNRKSDKDVSLLFDGSDDEEESKDFERTMEDKGLQYDSIEDPFLENSRECVLATLVHLSKEKVCAKHLAEHLRLTAIIVDVCTMLDSRAHLWCLIILANLTRLPSNQWNLVARHPSLIPTLTFALSCKQEETRRFAAYTIQNLSMNSRVRDELADSCTLLKILCKSVVLGDVSASNGESLASIATLKNLVSDASNIFKMLNAPVFLKNLTVVALRAEAFVTDDMQFMACDTLATFSHWLDRVSRTPLLKEEKYVKVALPTHQNVGWKTWEED